VIIEVGLLIYCLIECIQTPSDQVRNLPKVGWVLLIILLPLIGGICWLFLGRPIGARGAVPWPTGPTAGYPEYERPRRRTIGPDDDPDFLREISAVNNEQAQTLAQWEADLKRREQELKGRTDPPRPDQTPPSEQDRPKDA